MNFKFTTYRRLTLLFKQNKQLLLGNNSKTRYASTIFALSSGHGKCGVAVIRVSGEGTQNALKTLASISDLPRPRTATLRSIRHPLTNEILDRGLVLWFPRPHSYTGEDCCELHVHGGVAVVSAVLDALALLPQLRLAEPGEFTRRSFNNGKLDLTQVEGLADLLQAETEAQRKQAFLQTQGALSKLYNRWRTVLTRCVAHVEAHIDFDETETLNEDVLDAVIGQVEQLYGEIKRHLDDGRKGEILRNGVKTVILGEPNVGKSSLLNLLCQRPAAIVTPIAGTTRDVLEVTLNIAGYPLILADTAGLRRRTEDIVEQEGIDRAMQSYVTADLIILVVDCTKSTSLNIVDYLKYYVQTLNLDDLIDDNSKTVDTLFKRNCIVVLNKTDLLASLNNTHAGIDGGDNVILPMSCKNQTGGENLIKVITSHLKILCGQPSSEQPSMNQVRHRQNLSDCVKYLNRFLSSHHQAGTDLVLMAEDLRKSLKSLGKLVGAVTTEQLLDVIFKDFCIGK